MLSYSSFGPGGLRAPCVLACAMRSLAIVITIVQSFSILFLRLLPLTHFGESPVCENLFSPLAFKLDCFVELTLKKFFLYGGRLPFGRLC